MMNLPPSISSRGVNDLVLEAALTHARTVRGRKTRILEIGSGKGALASRLRDLLAAEGIDHELTCTDIEPHQINNAGLGFECIGLDAQEAFPLSGPYDIGIAVEIIEHTENPFHLVREFAKVLAPGALFVMTSPNTLSLTSRLRYMLVGTVDYFRRPYNEYWLNMGHVNPINPLQLIYALRKNGFGVRGVQTNKRTLSAMLLAPLGLLVWAASFSQFRRARRDGGTEQRRRNMEALRLTCSPDMMFGKIAIYTTKRERDIIATPDTWFRRDDNFKP